MNRHTQPKIHSPSAQHLPHSELQRLQRKRRNYCHKLQEWELRGVHRVHRSFHSLFGSKWLLRLLSNIFVNQKNKCMMKRQCVMNGSDQNGTRLKNCLQTFVLNIFNQNGGKIQKCYATIQTSHRSVNITFTLVPVSGLSWVVCIGQLYFCRLNTFVPKE